MAKSSAKKKVDRSYDLAKRTAFEISNFKGFKNLQINGLKQVNLFSGKNNVGKTSLLEALFIHCGIDNISLPLRVTTIRGIQSFDMDLDNLFSHLYFDCQFDNPIVFKATDIEKHWSTVSLELTTANDLITTGNYSNDSSASTASNLSALELKYTDSSGRKLSSKATPQLNDAKNEALKYEGMTAHRISPSNRGIFLSSKANTAEENADRFSKIAERKGTEKLLPFLQHIEPRLQKLEILRHGGKSIIHADIGTSRLIPIAYCGEGLQRLVTILLAITNASGGIVLIDEVENGIHYSVMSQIWQSIMEVSKEYNTQIFSTTHSWECIKAAHECFIETDYDFCLQRIERSPDGSISAKRYTKEVLHTAVESNIEVR